MILQKSFFILKNPHSRCRRQRALSFIGGRKFAIFSLLISQKKIVIRYLGTRTK
jgi:hypothetical protein